MGRGKKPLAGRLASAGSAGSAGPASSVVSAGRTGESEEQLFRPQSKNPAARSAGRKAKNPQLYCPTRDCLWVTGGGPCPRHGGPEWSGERQRLVDAVSSRRAGAADLARLAELSVEFDEKALFPLEAGLLLHVELYNGVVTLSSRGDEQRSAPALDLIALLSATPDDQKALGLMTPKERDALLIWLKARVAVDEPVVPAGPRSRPSSLAS